MQGPLNVRLRRLGLSRQARQLIATAAGQPGWRPIAQLDAAVRLVESLVQSGGVPRGAAAGRSVSSLLDQQGDAPTDQSAIPDRFWSVRPVSDAGGDEQILLRGAVLVRVHGRLNRPVTPMKKYRGANAAACDETAAETAAPLGAELAAALAEPESRPLAKVWRMVRGAGWVSLLSLVACVGLVAVCTVWESLLWRGILDLGRDLALVQQRLAALGCLVVLGVGLMLLEYRIGSGLYRLGRRLETTLRAEFLSKIPRLHDRYLQSRPTSDMAERAHSLQRVRLVPQVAGQFLRAVAALSTTAAAIAWIEPTSAWMAFLAAGMAVLLPMLFLPMLEGLDLRIRTHAGALTRFTFDSLQGLAAVRAHGAQQAVSVEHESLLVEWARASHRLLRWRVMVDGLQSFAGITMAAWLLMSHASHTVDATGVLLLAYWALSIRALGDEIALLVHQYPGHRNVTLRLLEPLGAPEQDLLVVSGDGEMPAVATRSRVTPKTTGTVIRLENVHVRAAGHTILASLDLAIPSQGHVAIVGPSGAGKSSLVGLLLGWHHATEGQVLVDDAPLDGARLAALRAQTVWVDPVVQLWNRSLLENLLYGNSETGLGQVGDVAQQADLFDVLQRLPDGLQTPLGESGGLLSGGEGQRVRLGRGFARCNPRLVILDEPFRGLERERRRVLLERARQRWQAATLICITHDVGETLGFPRVLVLDSGRLVEDGSPTQLAARPDSLYRSMLEAEDAVRNGLWGSNIWRRLKLRAGRLDSTAAADGDAP